jgi:DNA replication licensing factor MCM2
VANPIEGRYDPQQTFAANVGLTDPILSRFDILSVIKDEADAVQDERLADHVACSHIRSHPEANANDKAVKPRLQQKASHIEPIPQELLQKYIIYARQRVFPKLMDLDREKLANFYKDIRAEAFRTGGAPMTARHIESIIRLAEANARLELRQHVNARDLDNALSTMLESFIQSQKHQVAEDLRKRFRRYIAQATPMADQVFAMLEKAFRDKFEQRRISLRPGALPPDVSEVPVDIAEIARLTQINDLDGDEVAAFMLTERFRQSFRKEGDRLYRVV